ncbi:Rho GTPase activation protein [Phlyctochytrium arcticum]|nr:Rho GTPase activation protein [Phlyctochytrium arcticum]
MSEDQKAESIIQGLCDSENGFHLLLDRIKQDIFTTKEAVAFLKKRAQIEEDYAKAMLKLAQSGTGVKNEGKEGSFGNAWTQFVKIHEQVGETRLKFSEAVSDVSEQLAALHKNTERSRKQLKEAGHKHSRIVQEAEAALEKAKTRYESTSEDWERAILQKEQQIERDGFGKYIGSAPSGLHRSMSTKNVSGKGLPNPMNRWKTQNPVKLQKNEDDARTKAALANDNYKTQLQQTNTIRATYFQNHLPRFIRLLKETSDECDVGLQINLVKYAQDLEASLMKEATTLSPLENDRPGIVKIVENIDNEGDFEEYVQSYMQEAKDAEKGDHQYTPYSMSSEAYLIVSARPSFGLELVALLDRDGIPIPVVVTNCIQFVEQHGLKVQGLYRMSAPTLQVQKLRTALNRDPDTPRLNDYSADIHVVTNVLKLYFRELPDTLFPKAMYKELLDAARIEDERLRLINIHELINQLHDANYATLQALTRHLWTVSLNESHNRMTAANLSIVWGPSLLDSPAPSSDPNDIKLQTRILEVVIANFEHIFDTEGEA